MKITPVPAADAAMAVLHARFGSATDRTPVSGLAAFQADALHRVRAILELRGGAILADSVGLGKTHVAAALIRERVQHGTVLVCGPSQLDEHWRRHLRGVRGWQWLSHTGLSRGATPRAGPEAGPDLIVVDEAHALRNPATRRHQTLLRFRGNADVLLLTATPVNNSVRDFYHLVRLFARRNAFTDVGVTDLLSAVEAAERGDATSLRRVAEAVMVRRTRAFVQQSGLGACTLSFPRREPVRLIRYDLGDAYPGVLEHVAATVRGLRFPAHDILAPGTCAAELMRLGLFKRLESSSAAFVQSLRRYERLLHQFIAAAHEYRLLNVRTDRDLFREVDGAVQLALPKLALAVWPAGVSRRRALLRAGKELARVAELRRRIEDVVADPKIDRLRQLLDGPLAGEAVLVFTEYRDTAQALWDALRDMHGVALIHGDEARLGRSRASRQGVINRFAPVANGVQPPRAHQRVRVLIATDVLSEGLNLQDARGVISYDVPWNPVRLAQRIGRIDRLGSPHESVLAYAIRPDRSVDTMLGLLRRVRRKLRAIRSVGGDAPWIRSRRVADDPVTDDTAERLRLEYFRRLQHDAWEPVRWPLAARLACDVAAPAVLVWLRARAFIVPVLVADTRITVSPAAADGWLLTGLESSGLSDDAGLDAVRDHLEAAVRAARGRAVAWLAAHDGRQPADRAECDDARAIRRWLAARPGGATADDTAEADRRLAAARATGTAPVARPPTVTDLDVIAVFELVPAGLTGAIVRFKFEDCRTTFPRSSVGRAGDC